MNERRWIVVVAVVSEVKEDKSSSLCAQLQGSGLENNNTTVVVVLLVVSALWWWWWRSLSLQKCVSGRRRKVKDPRTALFSDDLQPLTDICEEWLLLRREASRFLFASYFLLLFFFRLDVFWSGLAQGCFTGEMKVERDIVSTNCSTRRMRWCSHRRLQV